MSPPTRWSRARQWPFGRIRPLQALHLVCITHTCPQKRVAPACEAHGAHRRRSHGSTSMCDLLRSIGVPPIFEALFIQGAREPWSGEDSDGMPQPVPRREHGLGARRPPPQPVVELPCSPCPSLPSCSPPGPHRCPKSSQLPSVRPFHLFPRGWLPPGAGRGRTGRLGLKRPRARAPPTPHMAAPVLHRGCHLHTPNHPVALLPLLLHFTPGVFVRPAAAALAPCHSTDSSSLAPCAETTMPGPTGTASRAPRQAKGPAPAGNVSSMPHVEMVPSLHLSISPPPPPPPQPPGLP